MKSKNLDNTYEINKNIAIQIEKVLYDIIWLKKNKCIA